MYLYSFLSVTSAIVLMMGLKKGISFNIISVILSLIALFIALVHFEGLPWDYICVFGQFVPIWGNGVIIGIKSTRRLEKKREMFLAELKEQLEKNDNTHKSEKEEKINER